jgi:hypothetical protein
VGSDEQGGEGVRRDRWGGKEGKEKDDKKGSKVSVKEDEGM